MKLLLLPLLLLGCIVIVAFLKAVTARLITGKWPHQCEHSRSIYRNLP